MIIKLHLTEGGKGSGNHGHKGIKGHRGGSQPTGRRSIPNLNKPANLLGYPNGDYPELTYQGTTRGIAEKIKAEGLKPSKDGKVYSTPDVAMAFGYALERAKSRHNRKYIAVVELDRTAFPIYFNTYFISKGPVSPKAVRRIFIYSTENVKYEYGKGWVQDGKPCKPVEVIEAVRPDVEFVYVPIVINGELE